MGLSFLMGFSQRAARPKNFAWCASILEDGFERRPDLRRRLPFLWSRLLKEDAITMIEIVEETTGKPVAFGATAIVSDDCASAARAAQAPNLAVRILGSEGSAVPWILRPAQVRALNHPGHGVNLCILHYSEVVPGRSFAEVQLVRDKAVAALLRTQSGYAMREFLFEFYGREDVEFMSRMGALLRTDYSGYFAAVGESRPHPTRHPFLFGLTAEEMVRQWGTPVAMLFAYEEPRIFFTWTQQRVLTRASRTPTPTDAEIATELGVKRSTLREHWRGVFSRVAAAQESGRLPSIELPHFGSPSSELRAALLAYVNEHPCELRPIDARHFAGQVRRASIRALA